MSSAPEFRSIEKVAAKLIELNSSQADLDKTLSNLKQEKRRLENILQLPMKELPSKFESHYSYIYPLVKEMYQAELREKELKEEFYNKQLLMQSRQLGQNLLAASLKKEETVLKRWNDELKEMKHLQPAISTTSAESQEFSTLHDVVYNCSYNGSRITESLSVTVLYQSVHVRLQMHSVLRCSNIHCFTTDSAEINVSSDTYIPALEESAAEMLEKGSSIEGLISKIAAYIASDMAPFVISIPIRKKKKQKKPKSSDSNPKDSCGDHQEVQVAAGKTVEVEENSKKDEPAKDGKTDVAIHPFDGPEPVTPQ